MDQAGVNGCAAEADQQQPRQGRRFPQRQQQEHHPHRDQAKAHPNHLCIVQLQGQKAAEGPARSDAEEKQAGKAGGGFRGDAPVQHQIAASPQTRGLLQRAVTEKCDQNLFHAGDAEDLFQGQSLCGGRFLLPCVRSRFGLPEREAQNDNHRQYHLHPADDTVAHLPPGASRQGSPHDVRPD